MKAALKNTRKMFILQVQIESECSEFYEKYYFMKFDKSLDSFILFESVAKGDFSEKNLHLPVKDSISQGITCNISNIGLNFRYHNLNMNFQYLYRVFP